MTSLQRSLTNPGYRNWVKGGLSLKVAKEGIENFVQRNIDQFHQDVLNGLPSGANCSNCSTINIIPCKTNNNFCKFSNNKCKVHDSKDPNKKSRPCPNSECNVIRDKIIKKHRFNGPSWNNTDSSLWCREPWQLAVCYMSDGYKASTSATETDFTGLLAVIINNKVFNTEVTDNLASKNNVFGKAREVRNAILHNPEMTLTDGELAGYIAALDNMLNDSKHLAAHPDSIKARALLQQILNGSLNVTTHDEAAVLADALRAIKEKTEEALATIDTKEQLSVAALQKALEEAQKQLKVKEQESVATLQLSVAALQKALDEAQAQITAKQQEAVDTIKTVSAETYDTKKKALRDELLSVYQDGEKLSSTLGPVATDEDKHIDELYVTPNMKLVDHNKQDDKGQQIEGYQDIFKDGNKKIYIEGEAGTGKTSLCQKMVSTWCQIKTTQIEEKSDDQQALAKFDYLFYISLRDVITDNTIEEMIIHHLLPNKQSLHEPLSRVLEEENCLIILDGLDEWTTENKTAAAVNRGLPGRDAVRNCTVVTTTRPWKLESLKLKSTQIEAKVNLLGIDKISSKKLAQNMIKNLNHKFNCQKTYANFISEITKKDLKSLMSIPVLLKQIVCLWHSGKNLGKSKHDIYNQTLELLLELALPRLQEDPQYQQKREQWRKSSRKRSLWKNILTKSTLKLPFCFDDKPQCQHFKPLLVVLSKLAFQTLLSDDQESSLVFKTTQKGCYELTSEEVNICLKIGILSQNKILTDCTSQNKKVSFLHKTYHEYLAAMYVSLDQSETKHCLKTLQQFCSTKNKCNDMSNVVTFISGLCPSDITCTLLDHYYTKVDRTSRQPIIIDCMREGWTCPHDNKHLYCDFIYIREPSEYLDQLCQVNIPNIKVLVIYSPLTAPCLHHLLQIHTLEYLNIIPSSDSPAISEDDLYTLDSSSDPPAISEDDLYTLDSSSDPPAISEDDLYTLLHNNRHTLTDITIYGMTLRSSTRLSTLIPQVSKLGELYMYEPTLPQQLLTSLRALQTPGRTVIIYNPTILPDTESTD